MAMETDAYWQERAEQQILNSEANAAEIAKKVESAYNTAMKEIQSDINEFYARFGAKQDFTLTEVKKLLSVSELSAFQEQAAQYYSEAYKDNFRTAYVKEMRILSARAYMSRLEELKVNLYHELQKVYEVELKELENGLIAQYDESFKQKMYELQTGTGIGWQVSMPNTEAIKIVVNKNWLSSNYSARIWADRDALVAVLGRELEQGIVLGENPKTVAKRLAEQMAPHFAERTTVTGKQLKSYAERLARTEMNHIVNQAGFDTLESSGLFDKYRYLATLDSRTSEVCRDMDGKEFLISEKVVGVNFPPLHPNCRSTYTAVTDSDKVGTRLAKDESKKSHKYYQVPANMSYREWEKTLVTAE